jgi:hypothetical protein
MNFTKNQSRVEYGFIWLNTLKFVERRKSVFYLKFQYCRPFNLPYGAAAPLAVPVHQLRLLLLISSHDKEQLFHKRSRIHLCGRGAMCFWEMGTELLPLTCRANHMYAHEMGLINLCRVHTAALRNPEVRRCVHKSPPVTRVFSQLNSLLAQSHLCNTSFN